MKRIKFLSAMLGMSIIVVSLITACGSDATQNDQKKQSSTEANAVATETNTLYFIGEADYNPISYDQNGEAAGISPDIIREAFRRIGYKVKMQVYPWKRVQDMVKNGEADGFFSPYKNPEREQVYLFPSEPLLIEKNILMVKKDSKIEFDGDLSKLKEYTFGTLEGYATLEKYVSEGKIEKVDKSKNNEEALKKLLSGDHGVNIIVNANFILWDMAKKMGKEGELKELKNPLTENPSYLAFTKKKDMTTIAAKFEAELKKMKQDGTYDKIIEKYIGTKK